MPRPVAGHGMVYLCTTYMKSELLAITLPTKTGAEPTIAWRSKKSIPNMPSPLLVGEELYLVHDNGVASCLDAKTGREHWSQRLGGKFCSSPLYADGKIYIGNREGETVVLRPGTTFEKTAVNKLDGEIMAAPMALDDGLYVRTDKALYKLALPK
ncbi:MAG: PQQ-binding-like beta-propeller repeat protein [Pirellulales bacterium]